MANTRKPILSPQDIDQLKRKINPETGKPYTQSEIAEAHNTTRQNISYIKNTVQNYYRTPRERSMTHFPWKVGKEFANASPHRCMRDHMEFMWTEGEGMDPVRLRRLMGFYRRLDKNDVVVEFDPEIPPSKGISTGGFAYRKRRDSDGDLIIRVNAHTKLTPQGRQLLVIPDEETRAQVALS